MKQKLILFGIIFIGVFFTSFFFFGDKNTPKDTVFISPPAGDQVQNNNSIRIKNIQAYDFVQSPLFLEGEARGTWFFEASFPIEIQDDNGNVLGRGIAQASSDWMTESFVPFSARVEFQKEEKKTGKIIFKKDNPSGEIKYDDSFSLPVVFYFSDTF